VKLAYRLADFNATGFNNIIAAIVIKKELLISTAKDDVRIYSRQCLPVRPKIRFLYKIQKTKVKFFCKKV